MSAEDDRMSDGLFLRDAYKVALLSPDPSTQNGAILTDACGDVIARSCNRFPYGVNLSDERLERPLKYEMIEHAERNAIFMAARAGCRTLGSVLYCPWAACADCARAIIQAGVYRLVRHKDATLRRAGRNWDGSISIADQMLTEAGVIITDIEGKITDGLVLRHSGEEWSP